MMPELQPDAGMQAVEVRNLVDRRRDMKRVELPFALTGRSASFLQASHRYAGKSWKLGLGSSWAGEAEMLFP